MKITTEMDLLTVSVAEKQANHFLASHFGDWIFIGASIEIVVTAQAVVIYQDVADPDYFGATIHTNDISQIAINTHQRLRDRYYSVAHELWHLLVLTNQIPTEQVSQLNDERAADHFAATVMLPEMLVKRYWHTTKQRADFDPALAIIQLADLSAMPYVAITRRLHELGFRLPAHLQTLTEAEWVAKRELAGLAPSPLDVAQPHIGFAAMKKLVLQKLKQHRLTLEAAATILTHVEPELAASLWVQRRQQLNGRATNDD